MFDLGGLAIVADNLFLIAGGAALLAMVIWAIMHVAL
jgi:hypothetical protein